LRQGTKIYFTATIVAQIVALIRYVILARVLGPTELGLAAMILLTSQFFDAISDTGGDRFIVQSARADTDSMQKLVQLAMAGRGALITVALVATAPLLAVLYRAPALTPALMAMGIASLIMGLINLDLYRVQRQGNFRPEAYEIIFGELAGLAGTVAAALVVRDHTAIIYGLVLRALVSVGVSHLTAVKRYSWGFSLPEYRLFAVFAAPLFINGLLLYAGSQGDRVIIARNFGPTILGQYSAILLLILYPGAAISKFLANTHMPQLAATRDDPALHAREVELMGGRTVLIVTAMCIGFAVVAPIAAPLLYGPRFHQPATLFAMLGMFHTNRVLRAWPTTVAIALGRSTIVMAQNGVRILGLPAAVVAAAVFHSLEAVVSALILGEAVTLWVMLWMLARAGAMSLRPELVRSVIFLSISVTTFAWSWAITHHRYQAIWILAPLLLLLGLLFYRRERMTITATLDWLTARGGRLLAGHQARG
jgi:O-antigen/teichoic acid export membrane protein